MKRANIVQKNANYRKESALTKQTISHNSPRPAEYFSPEKKSLWEIINEWKHNP